MRDYKPSDNTKCIECGELIGGEEYYWSKSKGYPPVFIHKRCYETLLPKKGEVDEQQKNG